MGNKFKFKHLIPFLVLVSSLAFAASSTYIDPLRIEYIRPTSTIYSQLVECFTTGKCVHDDKIRIYPMPCEGSGASDCTGCYRMQAGKPIRIGNLDAAGSCAGMSQPNEQLLRVFVGYERYCPGAVAAGTSCTDGQLLLSCNISSEGAPGAPDGISSYNRDCFAGRPYVRRGSVGVVNVVITATPTIAPADMTQCPAGTTGTHPSCVYCSDTSYKPTAGSSACTECGAPVISNSATTRYTTAGTTKTSVNDCRVTDFTCKPSYVKNLATSTCDPSCQMSFNITRADGATSSSASDGSLSALASTLSSGPVNFSISPNLGSISATGSSTSGSSHMFWSEVTGLPAGTYSVTATDAADPTCTLTRSALITSSPTPSPTPPMPSPSPVCGLTVAPASVTNTTGPGMADGAFGLYIGRNIGTLDFAYSPKVGYITVGKTRLRIGDRLYQFSGLPANTYTVTVTDMGLSGCSWTGQTIVKDGVPPSPVPSPTTRYCAGFVSGYNAFPAATNSTTGPGGIRTMTWDLSTIPFAGGDTINHAAYHVYQNYYISTTDTPSTVAAGVAAQIESSSEAIWDSSAWGRPPVSGTPGFRPRATSSGSVLTVTIDDPSWYLLRWVVPQCSTGP